MSTRKLNPARSQGSVLVMTVILLPALLALCALAIGSGYLGYIKTRIQNASNLAAYAGIENFTSSATVRGSACSTLCPAGTSACVAACSNPGVGVPCNYECRAESALERANFVLTQNNPLGDAGGLGFLVQSNQGTVPNHGGVFRLGNWFQVDPDGTCAECNARLPGSCSGVINLCPLDPCNGDYPCWIPNPYPSGGAALTANSVKIEAQNRTSDLISAPFSGIFGGSGIQLGAEATATLVDRCFAMVLDTSLSLGELSHRTRGARPNNPAIPPNTLSVPSGPPASLFAMRANNTQNCNLPLATAEQYFWCNMPDLRPAGSWIDNNTFYQSDYVLRSTPFGQMQLNNIINSAQGYFGVEPFRTYMLAFNGLIRWLQAQASPGDRAMFIAYTGTPFRFIYPNDPDGAGPQLGPVSDDMGFFAQLTNFENIGWRDVSGSTTPELHPNAADFGIMPLFTSNLVEGSTNIVEAIIQAANTLNTQCPVNSRKAILLASDSVSSCSYNPGPPVGPPNGIGRVCNDSYSTYLAAENQLLTIVLPFLNAAKVSLTPIIATVPSLGLGFFNRRNTNVSDPNDPNYFLSFDQTAALGYGGLAIPALPANRLFFSYSSDRTLGYDLCVANGECNGVTVDQYSYDSLGIDPDVRFRRPYATLSHMAFRTGGKACLLLPRHPNGNSAYADLDGDPSTPPQLLNSLRVADQHQAFASEDLTPPEQAARCAQQTLGVNPFMLVSE
ncbi:MAG: hypothetical protein DCC75_00010 [Proteobacteria bacterium]|nr:MAG: hypothetical protein DCC75_00010 [Pseudomonadota bacterium]